VRPSTKAVIASVALLFASSYAAYAQQGFPAPNEDEAELELIAPQHLEIVRGPVLARFTLSGMGIAPAGVNYPNTGHIHLLIDLPLEEIDLSKPLPFTLEVIHLSHGETEVIVDLEPGTYTLQAILTDHEHVAFDPLVASEVVTIYVRHP
jgi:hypothetical protein